jgi:HAD superfamily hydrolase (TIGR01509 family)
MTEAALFDWDGTLLDSGAALLGAWYEASEQVLGRRYPATPDEVRTVWTYGGKVVFPQITDSEEQAAELARVFMGAYQRSGSDVRAFDGMPELLDDLRREGLAIAVVTSKARERYDLDAERSGLGGRVDVAVCAADTPAPKPDPAPVRVALERLGVAPEQAVMIGDTDVDVAAARGAGVTAIGVAWGPLGGDALLKAGAAAVARDAAELARIVMTNAERIVL